MNIVYGFVLPINDYMTCIFIIRKYINIINIHYRYSGRYMHSDDFFHETYANRMYVFFTSNHQILYVDR